MTEHRALRGVSVHVAFVRSVNQGQRGHPTTADITAAFRDAGAVAVAPFRSNGTVVFDAVDVLGVARDARSSLAMRCGIDRPVFTRSLAAVRGLVDRHAGAPDAARLELTLFDGERVLPGSPDVEDAAAHRRCTVVEHGRGWALMRNGTDRESNGTPTVEHVLGTPASSRGVPTLVALVDRVRRSEHEGRGQRTSRAPHGGGAHRLGASGICGAQGVEHGGVGVGGHEQSEARRFN